MRSICPALYTHTLGIAALDRRGGLSGLLPVIAEYLIPSANLTHTAHNCGSEISLEEVMPSATSEYNAGWLDSSSIPMSFVASCVRL